LEGCVAFCLNGMHFPFVIDRDGHFVDIVGRNSIALLIFDVFGLLYGPSLLSCPFHDQP
jgi:hypothetical protein